MHKFMKFGQGAMDGGLAMSTATSLYVMMVSILLDKGLHTQGGELIVFCIC
jgi:hypothetical protein